MVSVSVSIDQGAIDRMFRRPGGQVYENAVARPLRLTEALATASAPVDTGFLRNNRSIDIDAGPGSIRGTLTYHAKYAQYVMRGTGIYGPHGTPIRPKSSQYLVFVWKNPPPSTGIRPGQTVYAREVRGQRKQPFLINAFRAASPWPVTTKPGFG